MQTRSNPFPSAPVELKKLLTKIGKLTKTPTKLNANKNFLYIVENDNVYLETDNVYVKTDNTYYLTLVSLFSGNCERDFNNSYYRPQFEFNTTYDNQKDNSYNEFKTLLENIITYLKSNPPKFNKD